jgi:TusA-related sulfurtransferase
MSTEVSVKIDARGMMCPRPIIELAKARRKAAADTLIEIVARDLAFESDVRAWCEATSSTLLSLERNGDEVAVVIQVNAAG